MMDRLRLKAAAFRRELREFIAFIGARRAAHRHRRAADRLRRLRGDKSEFARAYFGDHDDARGRELEHIREMRLRAPVRVDQPLVLISQVQRSGGTFLSRLFDSHPQCHSNPLEFYFGNPEKWVWPSLDPSDSPEIWFTTLIETRDAVRFMGGARLDGGGPYPYMFLPSLQRDIFRRCLASGPARSQRDVMNAYMTSRFNAWLDNQNLYQPDKRIVTGFVPRMVMHAASIDGLFRTYPDGRLISIVRDPCTWVVSALGHNRDHYPDVATAIGIWNDSTQGIIAAKRRYGPRVEIVRFEDLLGDTERTMRRVAAAVGIDFLPGLLVPTFNGMTVGANTHFAGGRGGVMRDPLTRDAGLTAEVRTYVESETRALRGAAARLMAESDQ